MPGKLTSVYYRMHK